MQKSAVLIIGSEGFIGKHLVSGLKNEYAVTGCDLLDVAAVGNGYEYIQVSRSGAHWQSILSSKKYHACINVSGSANVSSSIKDPVADFHANVSDVISILEAIRKFAASCKYLHFSSAAVYGNPVVLPVTEHAVPDPLSPYGWHKLLSEQVCREYFTVYGIQSAILRPFSVFGPGLKRQIFWDLYQKYSGNANGIVTLFGTGMESRDFIYIEDLVAATKHVMTNSPFRANIYNIGNGLEVTIKEAAEKFLELFDTACELQFNGEVKTGDPKNWRADITNLSALGYTAQVSMEEGLKKYQQWLVCQDLKSH
jgi:UDP-glucose 4-epimerase